MLAETWLPDNPGRHCGNAFGALSSHSPQETVIRRPWSGHPTKRGWVATVVLPLPADRSVDFWQPRVIDSCALPAGACCTYPARPRCLRRMNYIYVRTPLAEPYRLSLAKMGECGSLKGS